MFKHLLVATDGSDLATKAVSQGVALAKMLGAKLTFVAVTESWPILETAQKAQERKLDPVGEYEKQASDWAGAVLQKASRAAADVGITAETVHIPDMHAADGILATADKCGCDAIVMSTHGRRGLRRVALGSQASDVLAGAKVTVIVVK